MIRFSALVLLLLAIAVPAPGRAEDPAVARPSFPIGGEIQTRGLVFFVPADATAGAAAVGTAHTFDLDKLTAVKRGDLSLGQSRRSVARTSGFLVPPGRPFDAPGASLADDYVVYALDTPPVGVRLLSLDSGPAPQPGRRVRVLGVPETSTDDEDDVFGTVVETTADRIDVDLDVPYDLRGWGGAPVVDANSGAVVGMLQAYFPRGSTSRVIASPIEPVRAALTHPLDQGKGRSFVRFAKQRKSPAMQRSASGDTLTVAGQYPAREGPLISQEFVDKSQIQLAIDYPTPGAILGDSTCGAFVSGRAVALHGEMRRFDVIIVIDTSRSTVDPTGADINGNGITGKPYLGRIGSIFDVGSTDPGDSILAAEVAGARQLLQSLDPRSTRVGVVAFAGEQPDMQGGVFVHGPSAPAITLEPLTADYARVEAALDGILARDPTGATHMAAGVDQATIELLGLRGSVSRSDPRSEKIVLFFTDGQPTLPYQGFERENVRAVLRAANRADRANIRIHSFALGPDALEGPVATVEMASRTDGFFTPVRHPGDLVEVIDAVSFANLEEVTIENLTNGKRADLFRATVDGSWSGFLAMEPGENEVEVRATSSDGGTAQEKFTVTLAPEAPDPTLPPELVTARNRLLEDCLKSIKQVRITAEQEHAEEVRKKLLVEIERERTAARERAAAQSKRLQLEVDTESP